MHHLLNWISHLSFKVLFLKCSGDDPAVSKKSRYWEKTLEAPLRSFTDQIGIWCQQTEQPVFPSLFLEEMKDRGAYWGVALGFGIFITLWNFLLWKASPVLHKSPSYHWPSFCDDDGRETQTQTFTSVILTPVFLPYFLYVSVFDPSLVAHVCDIKEGKEVSNPSVWFISSFPLEINSITHTQILRPVATYTQAKLLINISNTWAFTLSLLTCLSSDTSLKFPATGCLAEVSEVSVWCFVCLHSNSDNNSYVSLNVHNNYFIIHYSFERYK